MTCLFSVHTSSLQSIRYIIFNALVEKTVSGSFSRELLKLVLKGRLPKESFPELTLLFKRLDDAFFYVRVDDQGIEKQITPESIDREFSRGSFPYLLLKRLLEKGENEALQLAYDLLTEAKE